MTVNYLVAFTFGLILLPLISWAVQERYEIILGTFLALFGWWTKNLFERWAHEKASISFLQGLFGENHSTVEILDLILEQLEGNLKSNVLSSKQGHLTIYKQHIEFLKEISYENIKPIRNLLLLNTVFQSSILIKRYNAVLKLHWTNYQEVIEDFKLHNRMENQIVDGLENLLKATQEIRKQNLLTKQSVLESLSHLRAAGEKIESSLFNTLYYATVYSYTNSAVIRVKNEMEKEILSKQMN